MKPELDLINRIVLITKTDGYQKKGTLLELNKDFAKLQFRDRTIIVIPVVQISQILLKEPERELYER